MCHPDRSVAKWRDLLCAPRTPRISRIKTRPQTYVSSRPERNEVEGPALGPSDSPNLPYQNSTPNRCVIPTGAQRSGGTCCAPLGLPESPVSKLDPQQIGHPDRSVTKRRDLLCAPRTPRISRIKTRPPTDRPSRP